LAIFSGIGGEVSRGSVIRAGGAFFQQNRISGNILESPSPFLKYGLKDHNLGKDFVSITSSSEVTNIYIFWQQTARRLCSTPRWSHFHFCPPCCGLVLNFAIFIAKDFCLKIATRNDKDKSNFE